MSPQRWERIKDVVSEAMACPPTERQAFLERACGDDHGLRQEVESLLACEGDASRLLTPPDSERMSSLLHAHHADAAVGKKIGPFLVKSVLGYGGMGVVYRAEQDHPRREVALKVVSGGIHASPYQQRLFRREVESLARLQHSGIAALYEAGTDDEGRQYFAMELIEGRPLTEYAREKCARIDERLATFVRVCRAIQYAHQRGVIHRDIKPSNIIVRPDGQPKVLDFGLAKLVEDVDGAGATTSLGKVHGTLSYMSPEQTQGGSVQADTRGDVYSLGVLLFELLTDRRPLDVSHVNLREAIDKICHEPPPRIGSVIPSLRGDLEIIIDKALAKEPDRRYQSADALADDIERFRSRQPISARRPSAAYHLRKLAARHRVPAALAALLCLAVSALAVVATVMSVRLTEQRDVALTAQQNETEAHRAAEEVNDFLVSLFERGDPHKDGATEPSVREIVDAGAERIRDELGDEPLVQARLMTTLGSVYGKLSDFVRARALLEEGLSIRRDLLGENHLEVAESLVALADLCEWSHDFDEGREYLRRALDIRRRHLSEQDEAVADVIEALGRNRFYAEDYSAAVDRFREVLSTRREAHGPDSAEVTQAQSDLAIALKFLGQLDEAESILRETLATELRVLGDHMQTSFTLDNLAHVMFGRGDPIEAERLEKQRVDMLERILHENHPTLTHALGNYAFLVNRNHGPAEAEPIWRDVLERRRASLGNVSDPVAQALTELARTEMALSKPDEAIAHFSESLRIRREVFGTMSADVGNSTLNLGKAYHQLKQFERAEPLLLESYDVFTSEKVSDSARAANVAKLLAELYADWNRAADAELWRRRADRGSDPSTD